MKTIDELGISKTPWNVVRVTRQKEAVIKASDNAIVATMHADNARLIAAAPDCYDALQRIISATEGAVMDFPKWQKDLQNALDDARKALAKASGEEVK